MKITENVLKITVIFSDNLKKEDLLYKNYYKIIFLGFEISPGGLMSSN
jgi:hypothetical protein